MKKKPEKRVRIDDAIRDLVTAIKRLERECGGEFKFTLSWAPKPPQPKEDLWP